MQRITPFLWFNDEAETAAKFYTSIFKDSKIRAVARYPEGSPGPAGAVMTVKFALAGQEFIALNGGPVFKFTEAISLVVNCRTQRDVDYYWKRLSAGGRAGQCGWLKDKFGVSWQIVPTALGELFTDTDAAGAQRVIQAMLPMVKLDIKKLKQARDADMKRGRKAKPPQRTK